MTFIQVFPKLNTKWLAWPDSLQKLGDLIASQQYLYSILSNRRRRLPGKYGRPVFLEYANITTFRQLCFDVLREAANNIEAENDKKHEARYNIAIKNLSELIELFEQNRDLMEYDMKFLSDNDDDYSLYNDNWYKLIYEELILTDRKLRELFNIDTAAKKKIAELKSKHNLTDLEIALFLYYNKELVKPGTYTRSIYNKYQDAEKDDKRILVNENKTILKNQIERIKKIMPLLNDPKEAKDDLKEMEKDFNKRFN